MRVSSKFVVIQLLSHVQLFATPWTVASQALLSSTISQSLLKFMSIELVMLSNRVILCCSLLLLPSLSQHQGLFHRVSSLHQVTKVWSFNFSMSPSNEYSGLISFKIDWFDLLAVQRTLKSLLQHHNLKVSIFQYSAFFMVQLSHLYMTIGKTIVWLYRHLSAKWCLCFLNMLFRFVIAFLLRSKYLLIWWPGRLFVAFPCYFLYFLFFFLSF